MDEAGQKFDHSGSGDNVYRKTVNVQDYIGQQINFAAGLVGDFGRVCSVKDGGCGGQVFKMQTVWDKNSRKGEALNNLGDRVRPPRRPRMSQARPILPVEAPPPASPVYPSAPQEPVFPKRPGRGEFSWRESTVRKELGVLMWDSIGNMLGTVLLVGFIALIAGCVMAVGEPTWADTTPIFVIAAIAAAIGIAVIVSRHSSKREGIRSEAQRAINEQYAEKMRRYNDDRDNLYGGYRYRIHRYDEEINRISEDHADRIARHSAAERRKDYEYRIAALSYMTDILRYRIELKQYQRLKRVWNQLWICDSCSKRWGDNEVRRELSSKSFDYGMFLELFPELDDLAPGS